MKIRTTRTNIDLSIDVPAKYNELVIDFLEYSKIFYHTNEMVNQELISEDEFNQIHKIFRKKVLKVDKMVNNFAYLNGGSDGFDYSFRDFWWKLDED